MKAIIELSLINAYFLNIVRDLIYLIEDFGLKVI